MSEDECIEQLQDMIVKVARKCRNCNFCYTVCPLFESSRGFQVQGPPGILQAIRYAIRWGELEGDEKMSLADILYACTTCNNCVLKCKSSGPGVPLLEAIEAGRKLLVEKMIGPLPQQRMSLQSIYKYGNPYGESAEKRLSWLGDLKVTLLPQEKAETLFYVGCTASYEPALHNVARSLVKLLQFFKVDFGILEAEVCCGDPVGTLGDEVLFQELVDQNLERFTAAGVKTIITTSPHCLNAFLKKYEGFRKDFTATHYTQFFAETFGSRKPKFAKDLPYTVTYHDPCYLAKHLEIYDPPRVLLKAIPGVELVEMKMNRKDSLCCGGGGGRMYAEMEEVTRLADVRIRQAQEVGADIIATACPWCHTMLENAVRNLQMEERIMVRDIGELLADALSI
jgi:Fe-S oxidoreductase